MLVLTRREGESIEISLSSDQSSDFSAHDLFRYGPIKITVLGSGYRGTRIGIEVPDELHIVRCELLQKP